MRNVFPFSCCTRAALVGQVASAAALGRDFRRSRWTRRLRDSASPVDPVVHVGTVLVRAARSCKNRAPRRGNHTGAAIGSKWLLRRLARERVVLSLSFFDAARRAKHHACGHRLVEARTYGSPHCSLGRRSRSSRVPLMISICCKLHDARSGRRGAEGTGCESLLWRTVWGRSTAHAGHAPTGDPQLIGGSTVAGAIEALSCVSFQEAWCRSPSVRSFRRLAATSCRQRN